MYCHDLSFYSSSCFGFKYLLIIIISKKGGPGAAVKLLPCDHEVMGSSPGGSTLISIPSALNNIVYYFIKLF
jgi:hypothetical protein